MSALLSAADLRLHQSLGIAPEMLTRAKVQRVTDAEAREKGLSGAGDLSGVLYPYVVNGHAATYRVRRDRPEIENGKPRNKYLLPYGCNRHAYLSACDPAEYADRDVPLLLLEAEKSALMAASVAARAGRRLAPVAIGGCWAFRGRIGKTETADGGRVDETGLLPDLAAAVLPGRDVIVWLDGNVSTNRKVAQAEGALARELARRGACVRLARMPILAAAINGPDDFRAATNDAAVLDVIDRAGAWTDVQGAPEFRTLLASDIAPEPVTWMWPGVVPSAATCVIAGNPGLGKSQTVLHMAAIVSAGGCWPDGPRAARGRVIIVSAEDHPSKVIVPRLIAAEADLTQIEVFEAITLRDPSGSVRARGLDLSRDVEALDHLLDARGDVRLVIVDPITAYLGRTDSHRNAEVRGVLEPIEKLAQRHDCAVLLISHLSKAGGTEALLRMSGSVAFGAVCRAAFLIAADPEDNDRRLFLSSKASLAKKPDGRAFRVESINVTHGGIPLQTSRIAWTDEPVTFSAEEVLAAQAAAADDRTARDEAVEWLREALQNEPRPRRDLERQAKADGLGWRTIERGAKVLGVSMTRAGFGAGSVWTLWPPFAPTDPHSRQLSDMARMGANGANGGGNPSVAAIANRTVEAGDEGESDVVPEGESAE